MRACRACSRRTLLPALWTAPVLALALATAACSRAPGRELQPGSYRAVLRLSGAGELPFGLDVAREEKGTVLYVLNGDERIRVTDVVVEPGKFTARMPGYETTLTASVAGDELNGKVVIVHEGGRRFELPFAARLGQTWRFFERPLDDNADMAGLWNVTLTDAKGTPTRAVADLHQRFEQVTGTIIAPAGDERFLAGEVRDEMLRLSRFDGGGAVLLEAQLDATGRLVGRAWSDRAGSRRLVAARNPNAMIDSAPVATRLRDPEATFEFEFRDLDGQPVSSSDPQFRGKVLLVTLGGSWCPNSHDEAALLVDLDRDLRSRGLAIVGLMFEQYAQFDRAAAAVARFRRAHSVGYSTLVVGPMDKALASQAVPQLDAVRAYPTTLFIDRTGHVRRVQSGFAGPAAGVRHDLLVHEYQRTLEALLAESAPPSTTTSVESPLTR